MRALLLIPVIPALLSLAACSKPEQQLSCDSPYQAVVAISAIQGQADQSPLLGKQVITQGVVISDVYPDSPLPGLMLQSLAEDDKPLTSEGLFVQLTETSSYQQGDVLLLQGTVAEINDLTSLVDISQLTRCGTDTQVKPTAVTLPLSPEQSFEALEGMWLSFNQDLIVNDSYQLGRYGELILADQRLFVPTQVRQPGADARQYEQQQLQQMLVLDDGRWQENPDPVPFPPSGLTADNSLRLGDTVRGLSGVLFQDERGYRILPSQSPEFIQTNPRPAAPVAKQPDELRIAVFNVLNFFTGHGQAEPFPTRRGARSAAELARQQAKLVSALAAMDADIIGLLELENNGYGSGSAIATLVTALNEVVSSPYAMVETSETPGSDAIKVGLIYRPATVSQAGIAATQTAEPFTRLNRAPVAQTFQHLTSGNNVTVAVNHFKSKGSCPRDDHPQFQLQRDQNDGQACWNAARVEASQALSAWLATTPTGVMTPYQLIVGDLNAYRMEDPVRALEQAGWQYLHDEQHSGLSYAFRGRSGALDHALATKQLADNLSSLQHWSINADEPVLLDYSSRYKSPAAQQRLYGPTPYRSSDHDPVIATFSF
ncbi:ExeM/NucH family extracellular endonuclease [Arsukibacterium sp.]|uniref:ExeM/NucH family extracellular endonuclease n=1 Tax=Arsukibacterium sp. TaxID=1977258 RepID=UPI00299EA62E|nr:ExeM/NucH family extracellular endonuclease [Arsukibacterium sp.]MDX1676218.1 ExeM/NucH family extracellular endonuclease [Arsukibacterium sp.]